MRKFKLSLIIAFFGMVTLAGAQSVSYSIKGGLNMSNFYADDLDDKDMKVGFHVGIGADLEFAPNIALQTGLFYSTKGAEYLSKADGDPIDVNVSANYLQLPIHIAYKIDVTPGTKVVLHAGPYIAYGIGGKAKAGTLEMDTFKDDAMLNLFNGLKPFDAGLGLGVGAEFGPILVDIGWDMGLTNLARASNVDVKNQNAYISLGYKF